MEIYQANYRNSAKYLGIQRGVQKTGVDNIVIWHKSPGLEAQVHVIS